MTDFKVTEEAVEAALDAHHCATHYISPEYAMRRAIEAALPVMFKRVGWIGGNDPALMNDDWGATTPIIYSAKTSNNDVAIFRIKDRNEDQANSLERHGAA